MRCTLEVEIRFDLLSAIILIFFRRARKECLWSAMAAYPDLEPMITDVAVPLTKLPEMMRRSRDLLNATASKFPSPCAAHAGDGNLHFIILFDPKKLAEVREAKLVAASMVMHST